MFMSVKPVSFFEFTMLGIEKHCIYFIYSNVCFNRSYLDMFFHHFETVYFLINLANKTIRQTRVGKTNESHLKSFITWSFQPFSCFC